MEKSCGLVVVNSNEILLLKYSANDTQGEGGHWDFPKGHIETNETEIMTALRELEEETGYRAKKMTKLVSYFPSVGYNQEEIHIFVASGTKKEFDLKLDNDEFITVIKMDIKKLIGMIKAGKIIDSKTICAVMIYAAKRKLL